MALEVVFILFCVGLNYIPIPVLGEDGRHLNKYRTVFIHLKPNMVIRFTALNYLILRT